MTAATALLPSTELPGGNSIKKKRVLLVDTSQARREVRTETMRLLGMEVDSAADVSEARSWWRPDMYDLVLFHVEGEPGSRDTFCDHVRSAAPGQQIAFLVGKPEYLAGFTNDDGMVEVPGDSIQPGAGMQAPAGVTQEWGILEACRQISIVRSVANARSRAMRDQPAPPRDSETRESKSSASKGRHTESPKWDRRTFAGLDGE